MSRTDDAPDVGRYGAAEVLVYDSRTPAGQAARMLMDLMPGVSRCVKLRHVAGMASGPPPDAIRGGLPMYIRYDAETRSYTSLHGVDAANAMLVRAKEVACDKVSRHVRTGESIVPTEEEAKRVMARSKATLARETKDIANGHLWALTGSDFQSTPEEIINRKRARLAERQRNALAESKKPLDESKYQVS